CASLILATASRYASASDGPDTTGCARLASASESAAQATRTPRSAPERRDGGLEDSPTARTPRILAHGAALSQGTARESSPARSGVVRPGVGYVDELRHDAHEEGGADAQQGLREP